MSNYLKNAIAERFVTPQAQPIPGRETEQVKNSAGGYSFQIDDFGRLERFLILGSEGGTYYATERDLTKENVKSVERAIAADGLRVVQIVTDISHSGRAPKNDPALLVLAMCAGSKDLEVRRAVLAALPKVARIGTHLFHFVDYVQDLMNATSASEAVRLIRDHSLPRECVPTDLLNDVGVWDALLQDMPMMAMVRNLGKMSSIGLLAPLSAASTLVCEKLSNAEAIQRARVHPIAILMALKTYQQGHGERGKLTWTAVQNVVDALDKAFYMAFKSVTPTGKKLLLALDVSGSMGSPIPGTSLTCREGAAAMALVLANTEKNYHIVGFHSSSGTGYGWGRRSQDLSGITPLDISPRQRLDTVVNYMSRLPFGGTDCSLPMLYASHNKLDVDAFEVITDNESWSGAIHPTQALARYRSERNAKAKSAVIAMTSTGFSIADPNDSGQLDVVGFDAAAPQIISDFIRG